MSRQRILLLLGLIVLAVVLSPILNGQIARGISYTSPVAVAGLPLVDVRCPSRADQDRITAAPFASGIDAVTARGWIAVGPFAIGGIAVGGLSVGVVSIGVGSVGVVAFGTLAVAVYRSFGVLALAVYRSFGVLAVAGGRASGVVAFSPKVGVGTGHVGGRTQHRAAEPGAAPEGRGQ